MLPPIVEDKNSTISTVRTYSSPKRYTLKGKGKNQIELLVKKAEIINKNKKKIAIPKALLQYRKRKKHFQQYQINLRDYIDQLHDSLVVKSNRNLSKLSNSLNSPTQIHKCNEEQLPVIQKAQFKCRSRLGEDIMRRIHSNWSDMKQLINQGVIRKELRIGQNMDFHTLKYSNATVLESNGAQGEIHLDDEEAYMEQQRLKAEHIIKELNWQLGSQKNLVIEQRTSEEQTQQKLQRQILLRAEQQNGALMRQQKMLQKQLRKLEDQLDLLQQARNDGQQNIPTSPKATSCIQTIGATQEQILNIKYQISTLEAVQQNQQQVIEQCKQALILTEQENERLERMFDEFQARSSSPCSYNPTYSTLTTPKHDRRINSVEPKNLFTSYTDYEDKIDQYMQETERIRNKPQQKQFYGYEDTQDMRQKPLFRRQRRYLKNNIEKEALLYFKTNALRF